MAVSRASAGGRQRDKQTQDHPKELFGAQGPIFWGLRRRSNAKGALERRGRNRGPQRQVFVAGVRMHRTATRAVSLGEARKTGGAHHVRTVYGEGAARDLLRAV